VHFFSNLGAEADKISIKLVSIKDSQLAIISSANCNIDLLPNMLDFRSYIVSMIACKINELQAMLLFIFSDIENYLTSTQLSSK